MFATAGEKREFQIWNTKRHLLPALFKFRKIVFATWDLIKINHFPNRRCLLIKYLNHWQQLSGACYQQTSNFTSNFNSNELRECKHWTLILFPFGKLFILGLDCDQTRDFFHRQPIIFAMSGPRKMPCLCYLEHFNVFAAEMSQNNLSVELWWCDRRHTGKSKLTRLRWRRSMIQRLRNSSEMYDAPHMLKLWQGSTGALIGSFETVTPTTSIPSALVIALVATWD